MSQYNMKNILGNAMELAKKNIAERKFTNTNLIADYSAGNISNESAVIGGQLTNDLNATVDNVINSLELSLESGGIQFTDAQKAAARMIAPYAFNPANYAERMEQLKDVSVRGTYKTFGIESMGVEDSITSADLKNVISNEAYDGQKVSNAVYFSIAYNLGAARQDEFAETFFPTITIDPLQSGVNVTIEFTSLFNEFNRSITGAPDKFDRVPVIKSLYNNEIFGTDKNKLVPVYRESDNKDFFLHDYKFLDKSTGADITTAPLKFGKKLSLLGISQTDELVAKGLMDNTDSLDRTINLEKIFFSMANNDDSKTDVFAFDAQILPVKGFVANPQDHHKSMLLNVKTDGLAINISTFKTAKGATSQVLEEAVASTYNNYKLIFEVAISGDANVMEGNVELSAVKMALKEIRDAAGDVVPTSDGAYAALKKYADKAKLVGYTLEAYRTNSNIRTRGRLVTNEAYSHIYNVPLRSGVTALYPINNTTGTDNDAGTLTSQVLLAGVMTSAYAVKKLVEFSNNMHMFSQNGVLDTVSYEGVSGFLVNPWYRNQSFELSSIVDSIQSGNRDLDIRSALRARIRNEIMDMYAQSNYGAAFEILRGNLGGNIGVIVGTDPYIKALLCSDGNTFTLSDGFEVKVVSTLNASVSGKVFITFGVFDANRNTTPNPLNFGNCIWSPTVSYEVTKTHGGAVSRELHNNPRFLHIIHLPIMSVFNITDVQSVFNKIPLHMKTIS